MDFRQLRTRDQFYAFVEEVAPPRRAVEELLAADGVGRESWTQVGWCQPCGAAVRFHVDWHYSDGRIPNYRERLVCPRCELNNRQRFAAAYVDRCVHALPPSHRARVYLYEQVTPLHRYVTSKWGGRLDVVGSEYLGHEYGPGEIVDGVRHEDALALSLPDASVDIIVSCDVYEHVPDYVAAFAEAARVLRPGGRAFVSVPFYAERDTTLQRTRIVDGRLEYLSPRAYHGNPVDPNGALVFFDFGWDFLQEIRSVPGIADAYMLAYYGLLEGYIGGGIQFVFEVLRA